MMKNILITGATGMVGKGILLECLKNPAIGSVTSISRSAVDLDNPKCNQVLLDDFMDIESVKDRLGAPDACFHSMGVSALGLDEKTYTKITFDVTRKLADLCFQINPEMTFNYVSGAGTDSSEKGRQMWARVKGRTENYLLNLGFAKCYMFRPGFIIPENGIRSRTRLYDQMYKLMRPIFPIMKRMKSVTTTTNIGRAMIQTLFEEGMEKVHLDNRKINTLSAKLKKD